MNAASSELRRLAVLVARDLREFVRDPVTLVVALVAPVIAALIASAGLGSLPSIDARVVVAGSTTRLGDTSSLAAALAPGTTGENSPVRLQNVANAAAARQAVSDGAAVAGLILPDGDASAGTPLTVVVNRNAHLGGDLAISAAHSVATRLSAVRNGSGGPLAGAPIVVRVESAGRRPLNGGEIYGPVIAVFFLFLASGFVARSLSAERERGTLARLRALPVGTATIVTAKTLTMLTVAVGEFSAVLVTMRIVYHAHWGNLLAVAAITLALGFAVAATAVMIASFARTYQSSAALVAFVALAFAVLGGNLVPLRNLPDVMRRLAAVTPNGIAIAALHDIAANGESIGDQLGALAKIILFGVVVGGLGLARLRRTVEA